MDERAVREFPWLTRLAQRWYERNSFSGRTLATSKELAQRKAAQGLRVSVALPALNEAATVGPICSTIAGLADATGLVDELVVLDGGSTDETSRIAQDAGASIVDMRSIMPEVQAVGGKGESLWRSLAVLNGDIIVWIDADIRNFDEHFVTRLIAPLIMDEHVAFVKAFYRRPIAAGEDLAPAGGGRVTELLARPLLNALFPELGGFRQPLSGEYAGRREVLERVPFFSGYSVEVGLLIDLLDVVGLDALAQVDLEQRVHRNRPLEELAPMAYGICRTILKRAEEWGRIRAAHDYPTLPLLLPEEDGSLSVREVIELERPPISLFSTSLRALRAEPGPVIALP